VVVEATGRFLQIEKSGRRQDGGITGDHRIGERVSMAHRILNDFQERRLFGRRGRAAMSPRHEGVEELGRVAFRRGRNGLHEVRRTGRRLRLSLAIRAYVGPAAGLFLSDGGGNGSHLFLERHVAEQEAMARRRPFV
jgi:hypothetical protein